MTLPDKEQMEREAAKAVSRSSRRRLRPPSLKTYAWILLSLSVWATIAGTLYEAIPFFFEFGREIWKAVS